MGAAPAGLGIESITVLIVDDHTVAREGLRAMLADIPQVEVVGEAVDGQEAMSQMAELRPSVVLMDVRMPGLDGLETTRRLKADYPTAAVIMMTSYDDEALVIEAVRVGASGYLLKDASHDLLSHTIGAVASGGILIKASLLGKVLSSLSTPADSSEAQPPESPPIEPLTPREQSVLRLLAEGETNREIADRLSLAEVTVKKHVQSIMAKLQASHRTHAAIKGMRLGLIK